MANIPMRGRWKPEIMSSMIDVFPSSRIFAVQRLRQILRQCKIFFIKHKISVVKISILLGQFIVYNESTVHSEMCCSSDTLNIFLK